MVLERVPRGHVIALDASPAMVEQARRTLWRFGDRVEYVVADLLKSIPVDPPVGAVISTATFHWIANHDRLFANLAGVIRSGGQLCAQCGGKGNLATVETALRKLGHGLGSNPFPAVEETRTRLETAGFTNVECWLHDEPTRFESETDLEVFLATVVLRHQVSTMVEVEARTFVHKVASYLPARELDYVRLNMRARHR